MAAHNAQRSAQPQPGALAHVLGRKKWLEQFRLDFRWNARTGVGDAQTGIGTRPGAWYLLRRLFGEHDIGGAKGEYSTARHGIAGVDAQVQQGLIQLRGVAQNRPQVVRHAGFNFDVLGEGLGGEVFHRGEQVPRLQGCALAFDSTGERQHLPDDGGAALGA